jgi:hypothetical protein
MGLFDVDFFCTNSGGSSGGSSGGGSFSRKQSPIFLSLLLFSVLCFEIEKD